MTHGIPAYFDLDKYNITPADVVRLGLHCEPEAVERRVLITPLWRPSVFAAGRITELVEGVLYRVEYRGQTFSLVRSGVGAPVTGDTVLALGCTPCEVAVFTGSVGGLDPAMGIGDLVLAERSICGDGFSRYLAPGAEPADCFLQPAVPDPAVAQALEMRARAACTAEGVPLHAGAVYSTDTIVAQFPRLEHIADGLGCIGIEMETAAFFRAAQLVGIHAGALLQVSDVPPARKSLFSGRTPVDRERRRVIREGVLARILLDTLTGL